MLTKKGFFCIKCGKCCRFAVPLTKRDIRKIRKRFPELDFCVEAGRKRSHTRLVDGRCPFLYLDEDSLYSCKIYDIRPKVCRQYPFFSGVKEIESCFPENFGRTGLKKAEFLKKSKSGKA